MDANLGGVFTAVSNEGSPQIFFGVKASGERFSSYLLFEKKVLADHGENNTKESLDSRLHGNDGRRIKIPSIDWVVL